MEQAGRASIRAPVGSLPTGTVTLLFTDVEGSTQRWEQRPDAMTDALRRHDSLMRAAIEAHGGHVFKTIGDAFCAAFWRAPEAVAAALDAQRALAKEDWDSVGGLRVRMALHSGTADERDFDYFGPAVNRVARLLSAVHGGQVVVSAATAHLLRDAIPSQSELRDLGEHRLKDLVESERVWQLISPDLPETFPALRSLGSMPNNLPRQLTSLIGRDEVVAEIEALVVESALVTLVGTGGVGKTRTSLQVGANQLDGSGDGVWFVELAALRGPGLVAGTIAAALGLTAQHERPMVDTLLHHLHRKRLLLVLDNCEHLVEEVAHIAGAILRGCPDVRLVATSREALRIDGERVYRMPSLAVPPEHATLSSTEALRYGAVALFAQRAAAADTTFRLTDANAPIVAEICRRLDGIALAIELAASRVKILAPPQLATRLDERFRVLTGGSRTALPRQQTLRALIDWSFDLLDDQERAVFRRLSVFAGSWSMQAAAEICGDGLIDAWQVFEIVSQLVAKSLVTVEPRGEDQRYRVLHSIRDYGRERLAESDERDGVIEAKHAGYYVELTRDLQPLVYAMEDVRWQSVLAPEIDNLRAVLDWTLFSAHDRRLALRLIEFLEWPELLTTPHEAMRWFDEATKHLDELDEPVAKARVLRHYVRLQWFVGRPHPEREAIAVNAVEAARNAGDPDELARSLANLAACYRDAGRFEETIPLFEAAHEDHAALSAAALNAVLRNWAVTDLQRGDLENARRRFTQVSRLERPGSAAHASALLNLGELEFATGDASAARAAAQQARVTFARLNTAPLGLILCNLTAYAIAEDRYDDARESAREAVSVLKRAGARWLIFALEHHAVLGGLVGDHERASVLVGFTDAHYTAQGDKRQRTEQLGYERLMHILNDVYDSKDLFDRMTTGAKLSEEEALAVAAAISQDTQAPKPDGAT